MESMAWPVAVVVSLAASPGAALAKVQVADPAQVTDCSFLGSITRSGSDLGAAEARVITVGGRLGATDVTWLSKLRSNRVRQVTGSLYRCP